MLDVIERCASAFRAEVAAFTRRNLLHAVRRELGGPLTEAEFDEVLCWRVARAPLPGLLPERCRWRPPRLGREWDAYFPRAILLVDRPAILDLFVAGGAIAPARLAVVCIDGSPRPVVHWLRRGFCAGRDAPVAYLHDASTVVYPFAFEPLKTLARRGGPGPVMFRDLGLPPLGLAARRFAGATLPPDEAILELEALPPAALIRYAVRSAIRLVPGDPNMLPLVRASDVPRREKRPS